MVPEAAEQRRPADGEHFENDDAPARSAAHISSASVKRETGASPVRTRHCKRGASANMSLGNREGGGTQRSASQETCLL